MLTIRLMAFGSLPAARAASSMRALPADRSSALRYPKDGTHPSATRPVSSSIRGLYAPSQMPIGCDGVGPAFTGPTDTVGRS